MILEGFLLFKVSEPRISCPHDFVITVASSGGHDVCDGLTYEDRGGEAGTFFRPQKHMCLMV